METSRGVTIPADLPPVLVPLAWLLGRWEGAGVIGYPTTGSQQFGQELEIRVEHDHLTHSSRAFALDAEGRPGPLLAAETGYWRVPQGGEPGEVEFLAARPTGHVEVWLGRVDGPRLELRTDVVARTASATDYTAGHRLYGLVQGTLAWAYDKAAEGRPLQPHMSAQLKRVG